MSERNLPQQFHLQTAAQLLTIPQGIELLSKKALFEECVVDSLVYLPRWLGRARGWSVAQHSLVVWEAVKAKIAEEHVDRQAKGFAELSATQHKVLGLQALLHDWPEAFFGDLPSPFKRLYPAIRDLENVALAKIYGVYELPPKTLGIVDEADALVNRMEAWFFFDQPDWCAEPSKEEREWFRKMHGQYLGASYLTITRFAAALERYL